MGGIPRLYAINKFYSSVAKVCSNKALRVVKRSHMTVYSQSECFVSA